MSSLTRSPGHSDARPLRRDAESNRQLILDAARQVSAPRGSDAGFEEIARMAGVRVGTVYRRFPDRAAPVDALFEQDLDQVVARSDAAAAHPDPWAGLWGFLRWAVEAQAANRGLAQVLVAAAHGHERIDRGRERIDPMAEEMVAHAQAAGMLRADVTALDLGIAMARISRVGEPEHHQPRERLVALVLDGLAVRQDFPTRLPASQPTAQDLACVIPSGRRAGPVRPSH